MGVQPGLDGRGAGADPAVWGLEACGARLGCMRSLGFLERISLGLQGSIGWMRCQPEVVDSPERDSGGPERAFRVAEGVVLSAVNYNVGRDMLRVSFVMGDATLSGGSSAGCGGNGFALPRGRAQHLPTMGGLWEGWGVLAGYERKPC